MRDDEAKKIVEAMREKKTATRRRRTWGKSRLVRYRPELVAMRRNGATYQMLIDHLRTVRRCKVVRSTVLRYLKKLPELSDGAAS